MLDNNFIELTDTQLGWSIGGVILAFALTVWVVKRHNANAAYGLLGVVLLPLTLFGWWHKQPEWQLWLTAAVTLGLFVTGMVVSRKWDDLFHYGALASSLFLAGALGFLSKDVDLPQIPLVLPAIIVIYFAIRAWKWRKSHKAAKQVPQEAAVEA